MSASLLGDLQNPRSPVVYRVHTRCQRFRILPTHRHDFLMCSSSIGHTRLPIGHVDHQFAYGRNMAYNRCCTCLHAPPRFLASPPRASEHRTLQPGAENCCWCHLTSPDDVITPRHQPCKHLYINPSPRQRHVIGWCQRLYCLTRNPTRKPGTDSDQYPLTLTLNQLTLTFLRWPLTKSQNFQKSLSCSVFHVDSNFRLCFFIWSSKIGQLAHSSLWFL